MRQRLSTHHPPYTQCAHNVWVFLPTEAHQRVLSFGEVKRIKLLACPRGALLLGTDQASGVTQESTPPS